MLRRLDVDGWNIWIQFACYLAFRRTEDNAPRRVFLLPSPLTTTTTTDRSNSHRSTIHSRINIMNCSNRALRAASQSFSHIIILGGEAEKKAIELCLLGQQPAAAAIARALRKVRRPLDINIGCTRWRGCGMNQFYLNLLPGTPLQKCRITSLNYIDG